MDFNNIPKEKLVLAGENRRITDKKFETKPVGYFKDAFNRFKKNKSSLVAAIIILLLFLFAIIVPFVSNYDVNFRDGYYKMLLPKSEALSWLGWDGCSWYTVPQAGYDSYAAIGYEYGSSSVRKVGEVTVDGTGKTFYRIYLDSYEKVGFAYVDLHEDEYFAFAGILAAKRAKYTGKQYFVLRIRQNSVMTTSLKRPITANSKNASSNLI